MIANKNEVKKDAFNEWMAYLLLINADQAKYGSLLTTFFKSRVPPKYAICPNFT